MSLLNEHLVRWITASVYKNFNEGEGSYDLLFEGVENKIGSNMSRAEIRINGPNIEQISKGVWKISCDINVFIMSVISKVDLYAYQKMVGHFSELFPSSLPIYKLGNEGGDDMSLFTCLQSNSELKVTNFGIIGPDLNLQRGSLDMSYKSVEIEYGSD